MRTRISVFMVVMVVGYLAGQVVGHFLEEKFKSAIQPDLQSLRTEIAALQAEVSDLKALRATGQSQKKGGDLLPGEDEKAWAFGELGQAQALPTGVLRSEVDYLARDLEQVQAWADREGAYSLYLLDNDLDRVERGEHPRGSFSDFFVPNMVSALSAGVPEAEVEARLERLIALAESGKPLSTYISKLLMEGGADAVRAYAKGKTGIGS